MTDYVVTIGLGICENVNLTDDELVCFPPQSAPEQLSDNDLKYHLIMVRTLRIAICV